MKHLDIDNVDPNNPKEIKQFVEKNINFDHGMFGQLVFLKKLYQPIVHMPVIKSIYMFHHESFRENPRKRLLELTSSIPWFVIPIVWIPFLIVQLYLSEKWYGDVLPSTFKIFLFLFGTIIVWPTFEYTLHRFVFHYLSEHWLLNSVHYMIHGVHHLVPKDLERSVFPPVPAFLFMVLPMHILGYLLSVSLNHFFGIPWALSTQFRFVLMSGFMLGYVSYDLIHWYYHAGPVDGWVYRLPLVGSYLLYLKKCHMQHHFVRGGENFNFGLTPFAKIVYDGLFGTSLDPNVTEQEIQDILNKKNK